jgi:hypothetical protein
MTSTREIKERLTQISSGPWRWYGDGLDNSDGPVISIGNNYDEENAELIISEPDASFIVNAESDIRFLLAEIERLQVR